MAVDAPFMADFAEKGNLHLFGAGIAFRESKGRQTRRAGASGVITAKTTYQGHLRSRDPFGRDAEMSPGRVAQQYDPPGL